MSARKTVCDCNPASGWKPCSQCPDRAPGNLTTGEAEAFRAGRAEGYDEASKRAGARVASLESALEYREASITDFLRTITECNARIAELEGHVERLRCLGRSNVVLAREIAAGRAAARAEGFAQALEEAARATEAELCPAGLFPTFEEDAAYATGYKAAKSHAAAAIRALADKAPGA